MARSDYPASVLEPMVTSCKKAIEANGGCRNVAGYSRDGRLLITVFYGYDDQLQNKEPLTMCLGSLGRSIEADLVITVCDAWIVVVKTEGEIPLGDIVNEVYQEDYAGLGMPPSQHPERAEVLLVSGYRGDGTTVPGMTLRYSRDADGNPVWGEWDEWAEEGIQDGLLTGAWRAGLVGPKFDLLECLNTATHLQGAGLPVMVFDPVVAERLKESGAGFVIPPGAVG